VLLISHFLTRFGDRTWMFSIPLLLYALFPGSLLVVALYAFSQNIGKLLMTPCFADSIVRHNRLSIVTASIGAEILATVMSSYAVFSFLLFQREGPVAAPGPHGPHPPPSRPESIAEALECAKEPLVKMWLWSAVVLLFTGAAMMEVAATVRGIAVCRDWVPQMALAYTEGRERQASLTRLNSWMQRLDLINDIGCPVVAGLVMVFTNLSVAYLAVVGVNAGSFILEYLLLRWVYSEKEHLLQRSADVEAHGESSPEARDVEEEPQSRNCCLFMVGWMHRLPLFGLCNNCRVLLRSPMLLPVIAVVLLYFNVMGSSSMFLAWLRSQGLPEDEVGLARSAGAIAGVTGTLLFPLVSGMWGVAKTSWGCLLIEGTSLTVAMIFFSAMPTIRSWLGLCFLVCVVMSRLGLYAFDIGQSQILQTGTPPRLRGLINAQEQSLIAAQSLILSIACAIWNKPSQFGGLALTSTVCCLMGLLCMTVYLFEYGERHCKMPDELLLPKGKGPVDENNGDTSTETGTQSPINNDPQPPKV